MQAYYFVKFILVNHLIVDPALNVLDYLNPVFFREAWLSLVNYKTRKLRNEESIRLCEFINGHRPHYLRGSNYICTDFKYSQQTAIYESTEMYTSYYNNIRNNFGNKLRRAVSVLLGARDKRYEVNAAGVAAELYAEEIKENIYNHVTVPFRCFKIAISQRITDENFAEVCRKLNDDNLRIALDALHPVLTRYPDDYEFVNNVYYGSKSHPNELL